MKRTFTAVVLTTALLLAVAATAWARGDSFSDNQYQGRAETDSQTFVGFDLTKKHGKTRVANVRTVLKFNCAGTNGGQGFLNGKGSVLVKRNNSFSGTMTTRFLGGRGTGVPAKLTISGKLQKHGKAKGKVAGVINFTNTMRGGAPRHCYSGAVNWKAKRGAIVNPEQVVPEPV